MSEAIEAIRRKYLDLQVLLSENARRRWAATEARALGRGGITKVAQATGITPATIRLGLAELDAPPPPPPPAASRGATGGARRKGGSTTSPLRVRAPGGGRKPLTTTDPTLLSDLDALIDPPLGGEQVAPFRWTSKSTRELARALGDRGHRISQQTVAELLRDLGYRLQPPRNAPGSHAAPERELQFQHLSATVQEFLAVGHPVLVVDIGREPREDRLVEAAEEVSFSSDRAQPEPGCLPYGSRTSANWISAWSDQDPPALAVQTIRIWWETLGRERFPTADRLLIAGPSGGSSRRSFQWKLGLQQLANETGLLIHVCYCPPGTSRWNQIDDRLFGRMILAPSQRPISRYVVVVNLIATSEQDAPAGLEETDRGPRLHTGERRVVQLAHDEFHGDWNYSIAPDPGSFT